MWILTPPGNLADADRATLAGITARCEELTATRALVREFADMLCHRSGSKLPDWADQAEASPVRELRSFTAGLRKDWAAVTAEEELGVALPDGAQLVELGVGWDLLRLRPEICFWLDPTGADEVMSSVIDGGGDGEFAYRWLADVGGTSWDTLWAALPPEVTTPAAAAALALLERTLEHQ
jgi:hypothetical protein